MYKTEQEEQDEFLQGLGRSRAMRLQNIWNMSYPHSTSNMFKPVTKEDDFRRQAKEEGFTEREIGMFLRL